jgi:uncharacterized protein (TIGR00369 family)
VTATVPTGLDALRAIVAGTLTPPPVATLLDVELVRADPAEVVFALAPGAATGNGMGLVHGGVLATLMDFACSCAASTELPADARLTTIELKVAYLRPVPADGGRIEATGRALRVGGTVAYADALARSADGELVAQATSSLAIRRAR